MDELLSLQAFDVQADTLPERASSISLWCDGNNSGASVWCGRHNRPPAEGGAERMLQRSAPPSRDL